MDSGQLDHHKMMMDPIKSMPDCLSAFTISYTTSHVLLFSLSLSSLSLVASFLTGKQSRFLSLSFSYFPWNGAKLKLNFSPIAFASCLHIHTKRKGNACISLAPRSMCNSKHVILSAVIALPTADCVIRRVFSKCVNKRVIVYENAAEEVRRGQLC